MKEIIAAICDDEQVAMDIVSSALVTCFQQNGLMLKLYRFNDPADFEKRMLERKYQVVFFDIDMGKVNGIDLAKKLKVASEQTDIIFVSNYESEVFHAFDARPFGFVRKSSFLKDVESVTRLYAQKMNREIGTEYLVYQVNRETARVDIASIGYIECLKDYQYIHLRGGGEPIRIKERMFTLEEKLGAFGFLRVSKGYLVSYSYIRRIQTASVELIDGITVSVSRDKREEIRQQYMKLSRNLS